MKKTGKGILSLALALTLALALLLPALGADGTGAKTKAEALKLLGLFQGVSDTDFALDRAPTRTEALVMLIRALGKEAEAQAGGFSHPFTDVEPWADRYVGYAYETGLTKGVSATEFGGGSADARMYLTFMLRALGYSDAAGEFSWNAPETLAGAAGLLPDGVDTETFLRADVAAVSWAALEAELKGGARRLSQKLTDEKVFGTDAYEEAVALVGDAAPDARPVSSPEALRTALADKSVKAVVIDAVGSPVAVTGELTIPKGVAVTVGRGSDLYVEGALVNNGVLRVLGADAVQTDFINYAVLSVSAGGVLQNNGAIRLEASPLADAADHGPVGGQLRVNGGTLENNGSVRLQYAPVNTHGGVAAVIDGTFQNAGLVLVDGFFLRVDGGVFANGGVVVNNTHVFAAAGGTFENSGTLSGAAVEAA